MRVTNKTLTQSYINNMQSNLGSLYKYHNQLGTGQEVNRPSDDPYRTVKAIGLKHVLTQNAQYKKNIEDAKGWTDMTDTCMQEMLTIMNRFKGLITQSGGVLSSEESLKSIAAEIDQDIERVAQVGNTAYNGRYIFGGFATDVPPFLMDKDLNLMTSNIASEGGTVPDADSVGTVVKEIAPSIDLPINITGIRVQNGDDQAAPPVDTLGETMQKVYNTIYQPQKTPNYSTEAGSDFQDQLDYATKEIDRHFSNMTSIAAEVGAKQNRLESALARNEAQKLATTELLSNTIDIDYVDKITEYNSVSNIYDAALASGAKLIQLSLVNYLR